MYQGFLLIHHPAIYWSWSYKRTKPKKKGDISLSHTYARACTHPHEHTATFFLNVSLAVNEFELGTEENHKRRQHNTDIMGLRPSSWQTQKYVCIYTCTKWKPNLMILGHDFVDKPSELWITYCHKPLPRGRKILQTASHSRLWLQYVEEHSTLQQNR
jgi:hypothetical protein